LGFLVIRVSRLTDYGIVLLARFGAAPVGTVRSARELGDATGIPLPTVSKILKALTRADLLASHRGTQGGYSLKRRLEDVSVADVIGSLDGPIALTDCAGDTEGACEILPTCPVRTNWQRITDAVRDALEAVPVSEMTMTFPMHHAPTGSEDGPR
jgi:FeS assembly SUF system regulator